MPLRSALAPGYIKLTYTGTVIPHHQTIPVNLQAGWVAGEDPTLLQSDGNPVSFTDGIENYLDAVEACYSDDTSFGIAEIFAVDADTGLATFVYATDTEHVGTSLDPQVPFVQGEFIFRTIAGSTLKVYTMEGVFEANARNVGTPPAGPRTVLADYITGDTNIFYGRRNAYPLAFISFTSKVNDRLRARGGFSDV